MASLLLYQVNDPKHVPGLVEALEELRAYTKAEIRPRQLPAVSGELAGYAIDILISEPVQALTNLAALGAILWKIIDLAKKAGKRIFIGKGSAKLLVAARAKDDLVNDSPSEEVSFESFRVWGPMEAELKDGPIIECVKQYDEAVGPVAYLTAIAIARPRNRVRTTWYLLGAEGRVCGSWTTQTLADRVPEFLRPEPFKNG